MLFQTTLPKVDLFFMKNYSSKNICVTGDCQKTKKKKQALASFSIHLLVSLFFFFQEQK